MRPPWKLAGHRITEPPTLPRMPHDASRVEQIFTTPRLAICLTTIFLVLASGCNRKPSDSAPANSPPKPRIGYVLHGLSDFTHVIQQGAEDAARAENVSVDVAGPAGFSAADAIAIFEGMTQKHVDGLIAIPMPGEVLGDANPPGG